MTKKQRRQINKHTLSRSILRVCLVFSLCLCLGVGLLGFTTYTTGMMENYQNYIRSILTFAVSALDGDDMARCIETLTPSLSYDRAQVMLNRIKETHDIEYIYILKPLAASGTEHALCDDRRYRPGAAGGPGADHAGRSVRR